MSERTGVRWNLVFHWRTVAGLPFASGDVTVTPVARVLAIRLGPVGGIWQRPVAIIVARDGQARCVPVVDVTRRAQVALLAGILVCALALWRGILQKEARA